VFYQAFKGRGVDLGERVDIHKNLHTENGFSIRSAKTGLVLAHCSTVTLINCTFHISESGRLKTINERRKRVHAFVRGELAAVNQLVKPTEREQILYNPYTTEHFTLVSLSLPLYEASEVHCQNKHCYL
jgi:hypothetical protein